VDKEIPNLQEKNSRAGRLREASRLLQDLPLERLPTEAEWEAATSTLSRDDLDHLKRLAEGYRARALAAQGEQPASDLVQEAAAALLLWPQDPVWTQETQGLYRKAGWQGQEIQAFFSALEKRTGRRSRGQKRHFPWFWPFVITLLVVPASIALVVALWSNSNQESAISPVQGPRNLEAVFDTQGVKTNIQVAQSRMILFPDATVAEISAWVTFPNHRVDVWEGTVAVLDAQGQPLTQRDVVFHPSSQGPLEPGQGVEVFQQFDAWPFFNKVTAFQVTTRRILAQEAHPQNRKEMAVQGVESLTTGYNLRVWILGDQWADRFASKVHTLALELENTGLKPFAELQFALVWRDDHGKTLKTLLFRPVSAFRTALPSGARLPWTQETTFDTEVFSWPAGAEPHPVLELRQWR